MGRYSLIQEAEAMTNGQCPVCKTQAPPLKAGSTGILVGLSALFALPSATPTVPAAAYIVRCQKCNNAFWMNAS